MSAWAEYILSLGPEASGIILMIGGLFVFLVVGMRDEWRNTVGGEC